MVRFADNIPEVRQLGRVNHGRGPDGNALRQFLVRVCSYRSRLFLPDPNVPEPATWRSIGLNYDGQPRFATWEPLLKRMHYVLALPESDFKKTSENYIARMQVLEQKRASKSDMLAWSTMLVQYSPAFAKLALNRPCG